MSLDPYKILGVERNASAEDIKKAFRKLAHQYHPDKKGGDEKKFKEVNAAYQILSDATKRQQYDQYGQTFDGASGGGGPFAGGFSGFNGMNFDFGDMGDLGDIMSQFFGGGGGGSRRASRGDDIQVDLTLSFEEMVRGVKKDVRLRKLDACADCGGTGAKDAKTRSCDTCHGRGQVRAVQRTPFGNIQRTVVCDACHGRGQVPERECATCTGTGVVKRDATISIDIPAGVESGNAVRVRGKGEAAPYGGAAGDLYVRLFVQDDKRFVRDGHDLRSTVFVGFSQAALGDEVHIDTIDGTETITIPAGVQSGHEIRLKQKGIGGDRRRGDHIVTVRVVTPKKLTREQKKMLEDLDLRAE